MPAKTHGRSTSKEYQTWTSMKQRCLNPKNTSYKNYGAIGIAVCERWLHSFEAFLADMGPCPSGDYSIERKDGTKDYSPKNCIWADRTAQNNNTTRSHTLMFQGRTMGVSEWARELNIPVETIHHRLRAGWPVEKTLTTPVSQSNNRPDAIFISHNGKTLHVKAWAKELGLPYKLLYKRLRLGWSFVESISIPSSPFNRKDAALYAIDGKTQTAAAWCREFNIAKSTLSRHLKNGLSIQDAVRLSLQRKKTNQE